MFEQATRQKIRFTTNRGLLSVEDVWDLGLEELDALAKSLNRQIKEQAEESFIETKTAAASLLDLRFEIVKHIIAVKLQEREDRKLAAEKRQRKQQILELIEAKKTEALSAKTLEELQAELAAL